MRRFALSTLGTVVTLAMCSRASTAQIVAGRVVTDSTRRPLSGLHVRVVRVSPSRDVRNPAPDSAAVGDATTAKDGVFSVLVPAPGTYQVVIADQFAMPPVTLADPDSTDAREYLLPSRLRLDRSTHVPPDAELDVLLCAGMVLYPNQVERVACVLPTHDGPRYPHTPAVLAMSAGLSATFVVDSTGHPLVNTLRLRGATDPSFGDAIRDWLPGLRVRPAEIRGRRVAQFMWLPIGFFVFGQSLPLPPVPEGFEFPDGEPGCRRASARSAGGQSARTRSRLHRAEHPSIVDAS